MQSLSQWRLSVFSSNSPKNQATWIFLLVHLNELWIQPWEISYRPCLFFASMSCHESSGHQHDFTHLQISSSPSVFLFNPHPPHPKKILTFSVFEENSNTKKKSDLSSTLSFIQKKKSFPTIKAFARANYYSVIPKPELMACWKDSRAKPPLGWPTRRLITVICPDGVAPLLGFPTHNTFG